MHPTAAHSPGDAPNDADASRAARLRQVQIPLHFASMRANAYLTPLWAGLLSLLFSGVAPELGVTPWSVSAWWIAACVPVAIAGHLGVVRFRAAQARGPIDADFWFRVIVLLHLGIGCCWAMGVWIHWVPGNPTNHVFLFMIAVAVGALYAIVRAGDMTLVYLGTIPIFASVWVHLVQQTLWIDTVLTYVLPLWMLHFFRESRHGCRAILTSLQTRTDMEQLAEALAKARDDAEAQRAQAVRSNATKTAFLASMSHELRTPLNAILGFSEIISTEALGPDAGDAYKDYATDIHASGAHLLSLLNDLLDIAKVEAGKLDLSPEWLEAREVVGSAFRVVEERAAAKGVGMALDIPGGTSLFADERALRQVALNLLSNAVKFTPTGGNVAVTIQRAGNGLTLIVADTGCGIPQEHIDRVFEPFEQLDNRYARANGGTGLGLALVRALTQLHGGSCRIDSEVGRGTTVSVFFPAGRAQARSAA